MSTVENGEAGAKGGRRPESDDGSQDRRGTAGNSSPADTAEERAARKPPSPIKVEAALKLAGRGWHVFPVIEGTKTPRVKWKDGSTTDELQIRRWWGTNPGDQIGVDCGKSGLCVLDLDVKGGKNGIEMLGILEREWGELPPTLEATTPSGGRHLYFHSAGDPVRSTVDKLAKGVDTRGKGGFVLAPGSDGYEWVDETEQVEPVEAWVRDIAGRASATKDEDRNEPVGMDRPAAIDRATHNLANDAPLAIEGDGGDDLTYRVAAQVQEFGVSEAKCLELMHKLWNERCEPPWSSDDLETKVRNARAYMVHPPGAASPEADFDDVPDEGSRSKRRRLGLLRLPELRAMRAPRWLADRLIPEGGLAAVYGQPKAGKTFWAFDLSLSVASGHDFHGVPVRRGSVAYVAAEGGPARLRDRALAWLSARDVPEAEVVERWGLLPARVDLTDPRGVEDLIRAIGNQDLVVFDTLARCMSGDENSQKDMGAFVAGCDRVREATGAAVLVVHHEGKDPARGARGSNALRGAIDTGVRVRAEGTRITVAVEDQRDDEPLPPVMFELRRVPLDGIEESSVALFPIGSPADVERERIRDLAERMDGAPLKELVDDCAEQLRLTSRTARRRVEDAVPEGRDNAVEHGGGSLWLEPDPRNPRGPKTVRFDGGG